VLVEVMQDKSHPQRLKAAELVLQRGHGSPREVSPALDIIDQFVNGEISAITACLMLEAEGLKVPDVMRKYFNAEIKEATRLPFHEMMSDKARPPLPRSWLSIKKYQTVGKSTSLATSIKSDSWIGFHLDLPTLSNEQSTQHLDSIETAIAYLGARFLNQAMLVDVGIETDTVRG
jgi:hypothetical protein